MVNTKHDTDAYERVCNSGRNGYQREILDGNVLYDAFVRARKGYSWKPQVQKFEMNLLDHLARIQRELQDGTYQFLPTKEFVLNERGKTRLISAEQFENRIVKHALCDEILTPSMEPFLIYDNGASMKGKGTSFTRDRLVRHLRSYYAHHHSNEGYILLTDYSKYYDNVRHDTLLGQFGQHVKDERAMWLVRQSLKQSEVDVSYMSDSEYQNCLDRLFDSLAYHEIDKTLLTGEKYMRKRLNKGDQISQISGLAYATRIDNYVKIVKGVKYYGRHNDDSYAIHESRDFLLELLDGMTRTASELGITINQKKTRICKLSDQWQFMKIRYSLTETGRVVQKIDPKKLTEKRRLIKKLIHILPKEELEKWYGDWMGSNYKIMSRRQRENMDGLFCSLMEEKYELQNYTCRRQRDHRAAQERH